MQSVENLIANGSKSTFGSDIDAAAKLWIATVRLHLIDPWLAIAIGSMVLVTGAHATDLLYGFQSPTFGGNNPSALQAAEFDKSLANQRAASIAAAAKAAAAADPNQQFANAILSQLNSLVARNVALKIAASQNGDAGTIQAGDTAVTYVNSDGQVNIVITTPSGTTTVNLPTGG